MSRTNLLRPVDGLDETFVSRLFDMIESLLNGRSQNQGEVTLNTGATTTTVDNPLFESHQYVSLYPTTANAASVVASTYVSARTQGQFTITHPNDANADKTFLYTFIG